MIGGLSFFAADELRMGRGLLPSKKSTILFSNSDSDGPKVFEAAVNSNDLKPPANHTIFPPPPHAFA
jgi:hypothetical protein